MRTLICMVMVAFTMNAQAKITVKPSTGRKPSQTDPDGMLANTTFKNFLRCGEQGKAPADRKVLACIRQHFASSVSDAMVSRYAQALVFPNEYTELFYCDEAMTKLVQTYEERGYDLFMCFQSNILAPEMRTGVVLFKKEKGVLRITKIKM